MENWIEAKNVEQLSSVIEKSPPPIPQSQIKPLEVKAEFINKKEELITPATKVSIAKEIKVNFKFLLYALIIALISYPFSLQFTMASQIRF